MERDGFIFTLDVVLAAIPVFIIIASVTQITAVQSLYTQSYFLGSERVVQDVLESMRIHGDFDNLSASQTNTIILAILPTGYEYDYEISVNGSVIANVSSDTPPSDAGIVAGKRTAIVNLETILAQIISISHGGSTASAEYCSCGGNQHVWAFNFSYQPNDYDYWLLGEAAPGDNLNGFWRISDTSIPTSQCNSGSPKLCNLNAASGQQIFPAGSEEYDRNKLVKDSSAYIDTTLTADKTYYVYYRVTGSPSVSMDFFAIRSVIGTPESDITSANAQMQDNADVTLKIWKE